MCWTCGGGGGGGGLVVSLVVLGVFVCTSLSSSQSRNGNTEGGTRRGRH